MVDIFIPRKQKTVASHQLQPRESHWLATVERIDAYKRVYGRKPQMIRMRQPWYDAVMDELKSKTGFGLLDGLKTINGTPVEVVSRIALNDVEVL